MSNKLTPDWADVLLDLIWVQAVCISCQQITIVVTSKFASYKELKTNHVFSMGLDARKHVFEAFDQVRLKPAWSAT